MWPRGRHSSSHCLHSLSNLWARGEACFLARRAGFCFLKALISERYVMILAGNWWKFAYRQIHDNIITEAQSAKAFKKGILVFVNPQNTKLYR